MPNTRRGPDRFARGLRTSAASQFPRSLALGIPVNRGHATAWLSVSTVVSGGARPPNGPPLPHDLLAGVSHAPGRGKLLLLLLDGGLWVALDAPHRLIPTPIRCGCLPPAQRTGAEALEGIPAAL